MKYGYNYENIKNAAFDLAANLSKKINVPIEFVTAIQLEDRTPFFIAFKKESNKLIPIYNDTIDIKNIMRKDVVDRLASSPNALDSYSFMDVRNLLNRKNEQEQEIIAVCH